MGFQSVRRTLLVQVLFLLVGSLGFFQTELQAAKFSVPPASAPVIDSAGVMSTATVAQLNEILGQVYRSSGVQLAVLTVPSLDGLTVEEYAIGVASTWKLGKEKTDKGLLLLVAPTERRVRFEVGYGLEGELTDLQTGRIINDVMIPYFKQGNWDGGISAGVGAALQQVAPDALGAASLAPPPRESRGRPMGRGISIFVFFILFVIFSRVFSGRGGGGRGGGGSAASAFLLGGLLGSSRGRGGYGGGRGSSWGSWGGGGGGFGGGGASGSW